MKDTSAIQKVMNNLGARGRPFVFLVDFLMQNPRIFPFDDRMGEIKWQTPAYDNSGFYMASGVFPLSAVIFPI